MSPRHVQIRRNYGDMSFLLSRGGRKGPIICFVGILLIFALYQLGIICGSVKSVPTAMMVAKEVSDSLFFGRDTLREVIIGF